MRSLCATFLFRYIFYKSETLTTFHFPQWNEIKKLAEFQLLMPHTSFFSRFSLSIFDFDFLASNISQLYQIDYIIEFNCLSVYAVCTMGTDGNGCMVLMLIKENHIKNVIDWIVCRHCLLSMISIRYSDYEVWMMLLENYPMLYECYRKSKGMCLHEISHFSQFFFYVWYDIEL